MRKIQVIGVVASGLLLAAATLGGAEKPIETFTAFATSLGTGKAGIIDIAIYRWSTDEEREMLLTTLQEFGRDKLLDALEKIRPPVGYIRTPTSLGYDLFYARSTPTADGGRRVVMATNRPVSFREATSGARSLQYQFTLIEMHLNKDGKGEGKIVPAARVSWDSKDKRIEIENYNALPVDLTNIQAKKP
jgi:hypothetical protein